MRICFVYDALYPFTRGGGERRYWELARRIARDHEVHMVSWQYWDGPPTIVRDDVTLHGIGRPPALYTRAGRRSIREAVSFGVAVARFAKLPRFDVIDSCAFPYFHLPLQRALARVRHEALVVTWHEYWGRYWSRYLGRAGSAARWIERGTVPLADRYIAVSDHTAGRLRGHGATGPIDVVPNGIDIAAIDASRADGADCSDPASDRPDVLYVGRLIAHKRVDLLLHALAKLQRDGGHYRATIAGDGPDADTLRRLANALGLGDTVEFTGPLTDDRVYGLMHRAALLALPSEREGFGLTVLEAAACGTPALVTRATLNAAEELVRDGETGVVVESRPEDVAAGIRRVLDHPGASERMGACARRHAERFDWQTAADAAVESYERAIAARAR